MGILLIIAIGGFVFAGGNRNTAAATTRVLDGDTIEIFKDTYFYVALKNNLWIVFISAFGQIPLGFFLAYILSRGMVKGAQFFQAMIYLPNVISSVVIGILFNRLFLGSNSFLLEIQRFFNPMAEYIPGRNAMLPVLLVILWMYTGFYVIIFLANLQKIDPSLIEASKIDGATEGQTLRYIILPALSGVIVTTAILAISGSLKSFDLIFVMTGGGPARRPTPLLPPSLYFFVDRLIFRCDNNLDWRIFRLSVGYHASVCGRS